MNSCVDMPEMSRRAPAEGRNKDRAWDKCMAEVGYSLRGLHAFISALRALYRADSRQMCLLDPSPHHHSETVSPSDLFFFNLCEHAHIEAARADIARVSGAAAADLALADGSIYRTLLSSGECSTAALSCHAMPCSPVSRLMSPRPLRARRQGCASPWTASSRISQTETAPPDG